MDANNSHPDNERDTDRRSFLQHVLGAGVAVAGTTLLASCASASNSVGAQSRPAGSAPAAGAAGAQPASAVVWDMSWQKKLGKYKTVFDSPGFDDGAQLGAAALTAAGYNAVNPGAKEFTPVIVIRHMAIAMALNDAMWERLGSGNGNGLKDPTTGELNPKRNPFLTYTKGDRYTYVGQDGSLATLVENGAVILACNRALTRLAGSLRSKEAGKYATTALALEEIHRNLVPGTYPMPNGVYAVSAAQDAGCHYMKNIA